MRSATRRSITPDSCSITSKFWALTFHLVKIDFIWIVANLRISSAVQLPLLVRRSELPTETRIAGVRHEGDQLDQGEHRPGTPKEGPGDPAAQGPTEELAEIWRCVHGVQGTGDQLLADLQVPGVFLGL